MDTKTDYKFAPDCAERERGKEGRSVTEGALAGATSYGSSLIVSSCPRLPVTNCNLK